MDIEGVAAALDIDTWRLKGALNRRTVQTIEDHEPPYLAFRKDLGHIERGTAVFLGKDITVVRGFPKIKRAFYLAPMVESSFKDTVAVEEKMNGYNVRAFRKGGRLYALTRGGYVCPFTSSKLLPILSDFLKEHDYVVCGEVVGTENPYAVHDYEDVKGFGFFVFDLREKGSGRPMPIEERNLLLEKFGIPPVHLLGIYDKKECARQVFNLLDWLAAEDREGVVLKDPDMELPPLKYTTSRTNSSDLRFAFRFPYDYGRDFFFSRIIREGYQAVEMRDNETTLRERAWRLGEAILEPMVKTIKKVKDGAVVGEVNQVRVGSMEELDALMEHLERMGVECTLGEVVEKDGEYIAEIKRQKFKSTDKIKSNLGQ